MSRFSHLNNKGDNPLINEQDIAAYILAGGESKRFSGHVKGMQILNGKPLISHCISRLNKQISNIHINSHFSDLSKFNYPLITDSPEKLYQGPLSGLLACMRHLRKNYINKNWVLLTPCDSPFIPLDLVSTLQLQSNIDDNIASKLTHLKAICISYQGQLQPTFSLWHKDVYEQLETAVEDKKWGGLKIFFKSLDNAAHIIEYKQQSINPFFNINTPEELSEAETTYKNLSRN